MWEKFKIATLLTFHSLRTKLLVSFIVVVLAGGISSGIIVTRMVGQTIITEAQNKVRHDLASAWMVYNERSNRIKDVLILTTKRDLIIRSLVAKDLETLRRELERVRLDYSLDVLTVTDSKGIVLVRARPPYRTGDYQGNDPLVREALKKEVLASTEIILREELEKEGEGLDRQAFMEVITTPKAKARPQAQETSGMILKAAVPILDVNANLLGVLYGGTLLNRNYEIVDKIKETVFRGERYKGKETGTSTIFQRDLRISTNVRDKAGLRAIGTLIARDVHEQVLENGNPWIDRAFVVNDWYITAYDPIRDRKGEVIGVLYVGTLEQPYADLRRDVIYSFGLIAFIGVILVFIMAYFLTRSITRPIGELARVAESIADGNLGHELTIESSDEVGRLSASFNRMIRNLKATLEELYGVNAKLQDLNRHYLEMLGFVTHELMQPMGVLKGYLIMLRDETLGSLSTPKQKQAVATMLRNVNGLVNMIQKYLQLGRIEAGRMEVNKTSFLVFKEALAPILEDEKQQIEARRMVVLIENEEAFRAAEVFADPVLLRIVFSNLIGNALKYGWEGGKIWCGFQEDAQNCIFYVKNEGRGIPSLKLNQVFEKFARLDRDMERRQRGTGLGLFNAKEIIEKHGGAIWAESEEGKWANFLFTLPKAK
jgi:two-component system NtrC family sensor kinase